MPPLEELNAAKNFSQRSRCYSSHSAKTLLTDIFELNLPTGLDPGHTTTSVSADQMIEAVNFEVTMVSNGLLEDLLVRSRGVSTVGLRGAPERSPFPSFVVYTQ